jgi:aminomethyltransferase
VTISGTPEENRAGVRLQSDPSAVSRLLPEDPFLETYLVRPGGATVFALGPDERVTVIDRDGGQVAELTVLADDGRDDASAIGETADAPATVVRQAHGQRDGSLLWSELAARGLDPPEARAVRLFDESSRPGTSQSFRTDRAVTVVVAAPAGRIVDGAPPPSELLVEVRRARPREYDRLELPPPLAEPRLDVRVDGATALAYEVRAGEFIQVIDVEGKQCSDFLAFHRRKLESGIERGLDATTTRSLMGQAYPSPGLQGKFYDVDQDPLIEVVRDTVGRHDTFGLACTARYYEDKGYPGHVNCTENFNGQVAPFGIAPRMGWEALNFFYNTGFDANMVFVMDEPWSRPGDYVLLRAMSDLVCASSSCPDDIDPANGWQVTPIHVRVYAPDNTFSVAIAHRVTADAEPVLTRETTFHPRTSGLTKSFVEYRGYWLPHCFDNEGAIAEYWACREKVAIMDLSPLRKWEILGPDAESLVQLAITRDARRLSIGQVTYTAVCNETGSVIDDATVHRLGQDNFRFVGGDEYDGIWLKELADRNELKVWVKPSTDQLHNLAVQGPASRELLTKIVWTPPTQTSLEDLRWFRFTVGRVGAYDGIPIVVSRTGYTGELGYEVWCHPSDGPAVWDAIWEAGEEHGLTPLGLDALDILRIESGLIFPGYEFDGEVDPFEAGIGFAVDFRTEDDFVGREALEERNAHPQRTLVGLELEGNETGGHGDAVYVGRRRVGVVTSGTRSPILKKNIAFARVAVQYADLETKLEVGKLDGLQKRIPATVVRFPFYDPEKTRPRS